jgi:hypothetical protein
LSIRANEDTDADDWVDSGDATNCITLHSITRLAQQALVESGAKHFLRQRVGTSPGLIWTLPSTNQSVKIGRNKESEVYIDHKLVSRTQATISYSKALGHRIECNSTTIPMLLNGNRLLYVTPLVRGDRIQFAEFVLEYCTLDDVSQSSGSDMHWVDTKTRYTTPSNAQAYISADDPGDVPTGEYQLKDPSLRYIGSQNFSFLLACDADIFRLSRVWKDIGLDCRIWFPMNERDFEVSRMLSRASSLILVHSKISLAQGIANRLCQAVPSNRLVVVVTLDGVQVPEQLQSRPADIVRFIPFDPFHQSMDELTANLRRELCQKPRKQR